MKKIIMFVLSLVMTVIVVLLIAPLFYSLDELKPRIEAEANAKLRGNVSIGHLSFSLFPSVKLGVEKIVLHESKDLKTTPFAQVEKVEVIMPLWSLIAAPQATLLVKAADIKWASDSTKKVDTISNFLPEPKAEEMALAQAQAQEQPSSVDGGQPFAELQKQLASFLRDVPAWIRDRVLKAKFSLEIVDSKLDARLVGPDLNLHKEVSNFDFVVRNIGFNSPIDVSCTGNVWVDMTGIKIQGPFVIDGAVTLIPKEGSNSELQFKLNQNWNDLSIEAFNVLNKKSGTPLSLALGGNMLLGVETQINMNELSFVFGSVKTQGTLVSSFKDTNAIQMSLDIKSDKINMSELSTLVPMVADYKLKGESSFAIKASGLLTDPELALDFAMNNVSGSTPQLAHPIEAMKGQAQVRGKVSAPSVELKNFSLKLGRSDLEFWVKSQGLEKINMNFGLKSQLLDLDQMMGLEAVTASGTKKSAGGSQQAASAPVSQGSLDEVLEEMAPMVEEQLKNEMLDKISMKGSIVLKTIRVVGAEYSNAEVNMQMASRKLVVKSAEMGAYGGKMTATLELGLNPGLLDYKMDAALNRILLAKALEVHAPEWKDDMTGELVGQLNLSGKGLRKTQLASHLRGSLVGSMKEGRLKMPVLKTVSGVLDRLPAVAKEKVAGTALGDSEFRGHFKTLRLDSAIEGRKVIVKDLDVVYDPQKAKIGDFRFKSRGSVSFDKEVDFEATAMLSPELIRVSEWKGPSGLIEIPMKLKGTMDVPQPDYAYTTKILTERLAKGAATKVVNKAAEKAIEKISEKAPEPVKQKINDLKKKFGF
jgi:hypothetical protein